MLAKAEGVVKMVQENWNLTADEWRKRLTPEQFRVLREHGTERAGSSPLDKEKRAGLYHCAGCDLELYDAAHKYDSGTGWPSFYQPIRPEAIGTSEDRGWLGVRTEVHCARCKGHLGHVFEDGPKPTGLRYCMNGVAMVFKKS
ncbi:MAG: peptide-methionine (R)-S-oxide reductase [Proteobacteria bacterium]|nr:peptide-methionine (R)-S-oxide reductase [Pseudomonadota bacterium]NBX86391.1 peptide-methionine (R)-S-oxide reductase [Pseudomonadota bacterium]